MPSSPLTAPARINGFSVSQGNPFTGLDEWLIDRARERACVVAIRGNRLTEAPATRAPDYEKLSMPSSPDDVVAAPPISAEDAEAHRGEWVLLRGGRVVDHGQDPDALLEEHLLAVADFALYLVPASDRRFH